MEPCGARLAHLAGPQRRARRPQRLRRHAEGREVPGRHLRRLRGDQRRERGDVVAGLGAGRDTDHCRQHDLDAFPVAAIEVSRDT